MKTHYTFASIVGALVVSAALVSAQQKSAQPAASGSSDKTVTYTGCLQPGTGNGNYVLSNAKEKGNKDKSAAGLSLKVVASSDKVNLADHVTQAVEVTGTLGTPAAKGDIVTLSADKVKWQADYCGMPF